MDERISRQTYLRAGIEVTDREGSVQPCALDIHLHEEDFRDRIEGPARVHLVHITQDRMALEKEVLELLAVEGAELVLDLLYALCVAPVARFGDLADLHEIAGQAGHQLEHGGETG